MQQSCLSTTDMGGRCQYIYQSGILTLPYLATVEDSSAAIRSEAAMNETTPCSAGLDLRLHCVLKSAKQRPNADALFLVLEASDLQLCDGHLDFDHSYTTEIRTKDPPKSPPSDRSMPGHDLRLACELRCEI